MKSRKIIIAFSFLLFFLLWILYIRYQLDGKFFNISEWGGNFLIVPSVYSIWVLFNNSNRRYGLTIIFAIAIGALSQVFLSRDLETSFWMQKTAAVLISAALTIFVAVRYSGRTLQ